MKRNIFIAAIPSPDHRQLITQKISQCEAKRHSGIRIQWTHLQDLHITIGFLPGVFDKDIQALAMCFQCITSSSKFLASVKDVRIFGNAVVLRLEPYQSFLNLFKKLKQQLQNTLDGKYHFKEHNRFEAHLTIGRIKSPKTMSHAQRHQLTSMIDEQFQNVSIMIQQGALCHRLPEEYIKKASSAQVYQAIQGYPFK